MASDKTSVTLNNGRQMPFVGLGTWAPKNGEEQIIVAVKAAIKAGYRHIDCAAVYSNERAVGHALKELYTMGVVKREDLFITSKLWNTCHRPELVLPSLNKTLEDLGVGYVDLYLIHWPVAFKEGSEFFPVDGSGKAVPSDTDFVDTWKAMEDCQDMGKTKAIGLSNFNCQQIDRIIESARITPAVLQVEISLHYANKRLAEYAVGKGMIVEAYASLGCITMEPTHTPLLEEPVLVEVAKKHGKTPAQIALRAIIQRGIIVIPKSVTPKRIEENLQLFDFELSQEEMTTLNALNKNAKLYKFEMTDNHKNYPFTEPL